MMRCLYLCLTRFFMVLLFYSSLECQMMATFIRSQIADFRLLVPLIQNLRNPAIRDRHWEMLSERIQIKYVPTADLTFSHCLEMGLQSHMDVIAEVAEVAEKEHTIEQVPLNRG